jgi:FixJ family two-component response regulator
VEVHHSPFTVAIVDDDDSVRTSLDRLCSAFGFVPVTYASARDFLTALADGVPPAHCLVLDAHMPEMSGPELLQHLKAHDLQIPTVMFTADDAPETLIHPPPGSLRYLRKPTSAEHLLEAIALVTGRDAALF